MAERERSRVDSDRAYLWRLHRILALYVAGVLGFLALMTWAEHQGLSRHWIGPIFLFLTVMVYAGIGVYGRTTDPEDYYVAGRRIPPMYNGMATAADWMSAASFIGLAGTLYFSGFEGLAFVTGWTGGFVLVALLLAPYLRKFGQYTIPDFLGARYQGNVARLVGLAATVLASFVYLVAQIYGVGLVTSRFVSVEFEIGLFIGLAGILVCSFLGGMRAVTWTQVAQYIVLIVAYLIPIFWMSIVQGFGWLPHLEYGAAVQRIMELEPIIGVGTASVDTVAGLKVVTALHATPPEGALAAWRRDGGASPCSPPARRYCASLVVCGQGEVARSISHLSPGNCSMPAASRRSASSSLHQRSNHLKMGWKQVSGWRSIWR